VQYFTMNDPIIQKNVEPQNTTVRKPPLKAVSPKIDEMANYHRQKIEAILSSVDSRDAAKGLLGCDIVAATADGLRSVRITKTRAFEGIGKSTTNREGITQEAGKIYIMKHRVALFLNITTGREGNPSCVWVEEAKDTDTGTPLKNNALLRHLGLLDSDRLPIFTESTAIVPGVQPKEICEINLADAKASKNTTGVFAAVF